MGSDSRSRGAILVVDKDDDDRALVSGLLNKAGYETRASASGEEALEVARRARPRLVILEVCLPGVCGYEVCRQLRDGFGEDLPIIFTSGTRTESFDRVAGLLVGADDYVVKPFAEDELLARVRTLLRRTTPPPLGTAKLTPREQEVLLLLAEGLGQDEIASRLFISRKTVGTHLAHIFQKLGVRNRVQAVALAYRDDLTGRGAAR